MRVLIEIGHPAHVHFFVRTIRRLEDAGHETVVVTRNKEMVNELLERYGIPFRCLSSPAKGRFGLAAELLVRWAKITWLLCTEPVDLVVSISGISTSPPAWLMGKPNLTFTDTEDARLSNAIAFPFSDRVLTPDFFLEDLGDKHVRYRGIHELSYLQDFDFEAARRKRETLGLPAEYTFVRLVANDALHDEDLSGVDECALDTLVSRLEPIGRPLISSQSPLPARFRHLGVRFPSEEIHAVIAGARCFVGDSPTMAVEAGILGTPSYLVTPRVERLGNMRSLDDRGLLRNFATWEAFFREFHPVGDARTRDDWRARAEAFRADTPPMNDTIFNALTEALERCAA